ncbi:MAG: MlaD family protein [Thermoanaerobaculaceae bacterium]|jgi:phospholipid/cholesterol/gamma-HCH transport system substrate-binding protein|nr:MlaD family protein [Thermoanaerobaculaceae bacterium]
MSPTARIGLFMIVALAILGVFIVKIEEIPIGSKSGRQRVQAAFPSVAGLDEKSPVRIAGVRIGIVERIALQGDTALVTLALDPDVSLHQGARAEVTSLGMLGDKYVELYPGSLSGPLLPPGTVLGGVSPLGFDKLLSSADAILSDIKVVTESLRKSMGGPQGEQRLDEIVENIRQLTGDVKAMVAANRGNVDQTMENFKAFSETLKVELPKLAEQLKALAGRADTVVAENRENLKGSIDNIKDLSARLKVAADNINDITGKMNRGEGSIGKLLNDDETVDNLNATLKSVDTGFKSLKETLGRSERWKLDLNLRTEALPDVDLSRTTFGLDLQTTDRRFFRIEIVDSPWGKQRETTRIVSTTFPDGRTEVVTTHEDKTTDSYTINAQVGYFYKDITLRAGVFESSGGVGIDANLLQKRLRLSLEAYELGRDEKPPHLRLEGRYYLTRNVFAYAGWDDPTWKARRSLFFGGGVMFRDDDAKYLLGTASAFGN